MDLNPLGTSNAPRKVRFKPKAPPKREQNLVLPKAEKDENDVDEVTAEKLLRRYKETSSTVRPKPERKAVPTEIAFGIGGSSRNLKSYSSAKDVLKNGALNSDGVASQSVGKEYQEPWDYCTNYPTTLPIRRPYSGNPELLDEEEFGDDPVRSEYVENDTNAAEELGLLDKDPENRMFFLQLPSMLPAIAAQPADSEVPGLENKPNPSNGPGNNSQKLCKLESLQEGLIGKMLVYKSGAVKLKIGDTIYDVSAGLNCAFAQDVVGINVEKKHCCNFGEINKRAIATLDIDNMANSSFRRTNKSGMI